MSEAQQIGEDLRFVREAVHRREQDPRKRGALDCSTHTAAAIRTNRGAPGSVYALEQSLSGNKRKAQRGSVSSLQTYIFAWKM